MGRVVVVLWLKKTTNKEPFTRPANEKRKRGESVWLRGCCGMRKLNNFVCGLVVSEGEIGGGKGGGDVVGEESPFLHPCLLLFLLLLNTALTQCPPPLPLPPPPPLCVSVLRVLLHSLAYPSSPSAPRPPSYSFSSSSSFVPTSSSSSSSSSASSSLLCPQGGPTRRLHQSLDPCITKVHERTSNYRSLTRHLKEGQTG